MTVGEYQKGIEHLAPDDNRRASIKRGVTAFERRFSGRVLSLSDNIVIRWGAISGAVKLLSGHSPSVVDTMLAATALEHDLYLATRNISHVEHSGAAIFNPWEDDPSCFLL